MFYLKYKAEFGCHLGEGGKQTNKQMRKQDLEGPGPQAQPKTEGRAEEPRPPPLPPQA